MEDTYELEQRLVKAKIELMTRSVFISTISLSLEHKVSDAVPTAGTDGLKVLYNPDFCGRLSAPELVGLMAHECWHIAFGHVTRGTDKNPQIWNMAGDHVINLMLLSERYVLPKDGIHEDRFKGMSTEQVYDILIEEMPEMPEALMDILPSEESTDDVTEQVTDIIVRANTQSQMAGKAKGEIPSEISRLIDDLINPKLNWKEYLNRFLSVKIKDSYSWNRPNRRFMPNLYLPSTYSDGLGDMTFAIDTSGSMTDAEIQEILTEIQSIRDTFKYSTMTILDCDYKIHNVYELESDSNILDLKFSGGGGTSFMPVLNYIEEHPTTALIYFTDLYGETNLDPVDYPILWVCSSSHEPQSIGETIYINPP